MRRESAATDDDRYVFVSADTYAEEEG